MRRSRFIHLTDDDDARLREIEQAAHLKPKVRLRAQVLRLSHRGDTISQIAAYTGRHPTSIGRDFDRYQARGLAGLADGTAPGQPPRITEEAKAVLHARLGEDRTWTARQLAETVAACLGIHVSGEAIRQQLHALGYAWKRTRYVPAKPPDPEQERAAQETLDGLKRGRATASAC
jgi:transposase